MAEKTVIDSSEIMAKIRKDVLSPMTKHRGLLIWVLFLFTGLGLFFWGYAIQLKQGLIVTAMRDYVTWGMYIANFVFFVAVSLIGMLLSAVLGLLNIKWVKPITRIAEMIALSFIMIAGLVIIIDMGRPDRFMNLLLSGRLQSPILWDVTVITTYIVISLLLLILPLLPDLGIMKKHMKGDIPNWQWKLYNILSLGWVGTPNQYKILHKSTRILMILIIPVALGIHTVTSWLFAATLRPGWDTTIFGPYFVTGAFVSGVAAVIIAMFFFRNNYKLKDYLTDFHFDKMGRLLVLVSLVYLYFNINEFLVPAYKMKTMDAHHLHALFTGDFALMFWLTQILGLILPILITITKFGRKPIPLLITSIFVVIGAWSKRYLIIVPTIHPHLPIQNVPASFSEYMPTGTEITITVGTIIMALSIFTLLAKLFPVIPMWEVAEEKGVDIEKDLLK
jgi:molybdopterin-containing oxidoreductase family membrane subunit